MQQVGEEILGWGLDDILGRFVKDVWGGKTILLRGEMFGYFCVVSATLGSSGVFCLVLEDVFSGDFPNREGCEGDFSNGKSGDCRP